MIHAQSTLTEMIAYVQEALHPVTGHSKKTYQITVVDTNGDRIKSKLLVLADKFEELMQTLLKLKQDRPDDAECSIWQNEFLEIEAIWDAHFKILELIETNIDSLSNFRFFGETGKIHHSFKADHIVRIEIEYF